jgi:hypothetical protein
MTTAAHERVRRLEFDTTLHFIDKHLPPRSALLQVGGEEGEYALHFARRGHKVIVTDAAACSDGVLLHPGEATRLRVEPEWRIQGVLCLGPYHDLGARDLRRRCLLECRRVVQLHGIVALSYLTRARDAASPTQHVTTPAAVQAEALSCGFEIVEHLATDGDPSSLEALDGLAEADYPDYLSQHLQTCCTPSRRGTGTHGLVILKKV